ncbi:sensor histidine kinase [Virgisporangium ochraceum]|uniref:sensor histidine kinase n=1 Tax=Virgisporangium ochraceum TaxID=65505 RepID=UPI001EF2458E|nr:histidine kinase [Virgisporangium ochraceum]
MVAVATAAGVGVALVRTRRRYRRAVEERGWLLERERESAARTAVDAERARIARELHDIVSHNVSLMIVQATAAREVLTASPDDAAAALSAVEGAGRTTMTELRHLLGLLAPAPDGSDGSDGSDDSASAAGLAPQPSLAALSPLIDRIAFAGLPVEVRVSGSPRPLPSGIDVTAYRIVQEALTNALKHGTGGRAEVTIRYAERTLRVEVLTSGPSVLTAGPPAPAGPTGNGSGNRSGDGAGRGLLGLRQRVAVYGGDLDARRRLGGGFRVRARIPVDPP